MHTHDRFGKRAVPLSRLRDAGRNPIETVLPGPSHTGDDMAQMLVLEGEASFRELLKDMLIQAGHEVHVAQTAMQALLLVRELRLRIVLVNLQEPARQGLQLLEDLRSLPDRPRVVAFTRVERPEIERQARWLGAAYLLLTGSDRDTLKPPLMRAIHSALQQRPASPVTVNGEPVRVLIVDDEAEIRELLQEYLTRRGHDVATAGDGAEALQEIDRYRPHLMLLDLVMPGTDGLEVLRRLKAQAKKPGIIIVTALDDPGIAEQARSLGTFDYLIKPIDLDQLDVSIRAQVAILSSAPLAWWKR